MFCCIPEMDISLLLALERKLTDYNYNEKRYAQLYLENEDSSYTQHKRIIATTIHSCNEENEACCSCIA